jgi:hypothetical protein
MTEEKYTEEQMDEALDAIHDTALELLEIEDVKELHRGLEVIISLARYKFDVRNSADRKFIADNEEI